MSNKDKTALVPKLRFTEFLSSGEWEKKTLGDDRTFLRGKGVSKADIHPSGRTLCIRYGELYTRYNEKINKVFSKTNISNSQLQFSYNNDVLIPSSGETKLDIATASCLLLDNIALGGDINIIRGVAYCGVFLSYYLNGNLKYELAKLAQGDTVVHLYIEQIKKLIIFFPSLAEQQKIADCLSSLDDLLTAEDKKLNALKTHKKGLMQNLFPSECETVPKLRFAEFRDSGEWEEKKLGEVISYKKGFAFNSKDFTSSGISIIKISDTQGAIIKGNLESFIDINLLSDMNNLTYLKEDDVIITTVGSKPPMYNSMVGRCIVVSSEYGGALLNQNLVRLRGQEKVLNQKFLSAILRTRKFTSFIESIIRGNANQGSISLNDLFKFQDCIPSLLEQKKIADCLSSLYDLIAAQANKIENLKLHKKGLMQGLFPSFKEAGE